MRRYELTPINARCPVCHGEDGRLLWSTDVASAVQHFVRQDLDGSRYEKLCAEIERLWGKRTCEVVRCESCAFVFAHPYVAGKEGFYGLFLHAPSYPQDRFEFGKTLDAINAGRDAAGKSQEAGGPPPALLEVGAGDGAFTRRASRLFDSSNVLCTEYSEAGVQSIRSLGIECLMTDVRVLAQESGKNKHRFSAICLFQVLEHMDDLDSLWDAFGELAQPGADLFFSVPNDRWLEFQETRVGLLDMPPNHVGRWNRRAFDVIGARHGWRLVAHAVQPMSRRQLFKHVATGRFFHARQQPGSLTDRTTRISNRTLRRICSLPMLAAWHLWALPPAFSVALDGMGGAQWAHLKREHL